MTTYMTTLYRKYRPQTFSDLAGQKFIVQTIMNEVGSGKIAHAYLFSGPRGVGKTTMARLLAKAINCEKRKADSSEPCNECSSCTEIAAGRNIDVLEIDAASQTGVDNVRENIIESAQFKPTRSKYKVFIIDEVHMLSTSAFNALLKTLEEPPVHVIFILATTELHKLPATVVSRCQRFTFKRIPFEQMLEQLKNICEKEKIKVDEEVLTRIIAKSDGGLRDAESLLGQIFSLNLSSKGGKKIILEDVATVLPSSDTESVLHVLEALSDKQASPALSVIHSVVASGANIDQFMLDCIQTLRNVMIFIATQNLVDELEYSKEQLKRLKKLGTTFSSGELITLIDAFMKRRLETRTAPLPQLPIELLIVEFCSANVNAVTAAPKKQVALPVTEKRPAQEPTQTQPEAAPTTISSAAAASEPVSVQPEITPAPEETFTSTIKNAISTITHNHTITTTLEQLLAKWNDVIGKIGRSNHSLTFIIKMCQVKGLDNRGLHLGVPYSLHKEKLEEPKCKRIIEDILEQTFAERIPILCAVEAAESTAYPDLASLASEFDGEVVA